MNIRLWILSLCAGAGLVAGTHELQAQCGCGMRPRCCGCTYRGAGCGGAGMCNQGCPEAGCDCNQSCPQPEGFAQANKQS